MFKPFYHPDKWTSRQWALAANLTVHDIFCCLNFDYLLAARMKNWIYQQLIWTKEQWELETSYFTIHYFQFNQVGNIVVMWPLVGLKSPINISQTDSVQCNLRKMIVGLPITQAETIDSANLETKKESNVTDERTKMALTLPVTYDDG